MHYSNSPILKNALRARSLFFSRRAILARRVLHHPILVSVPSGKRVRRTAALMKRRRELTTLLHRKKTSLRSDMLLLALAPKIRPIPQMPRRAHIRNGQCEEGAGALRGRVAARDDTTPPQKGVQEVINPATPKLQKKLLKRVL